MEYGLDHRSVKAMGYGRSRLLATHGPADDGKENPADLDGRPILLGGTKIFLHQLPHVRMRIYVFASN